MTLCSRHAAAQHQCTQPQQAEGAAPSAAPSPAMLMVVEDCPTNVVPSLVVAEEKIVTYRSSVASVRFVALAISSDCRKTVEFCEILSPEVI